MRWAYVLVAFGLLSGCERGRTRIDPPGQLARALERVTELTATAQLRPVDSAMFESQALEAEGASFSGFVEAAPGDYTLEIVFRGRYDGAGPYFLGRWASNRFTVVQGDAVTPVFATPLDTIGRDGDGGDDDADGLGLLDELLFGADIADDDTDDDGIPDGDDCRPTQTSVGRAARTGQLEDCDGDGELRPDRPVGTAGRDCNDEDATINPAAEDVCGDGIDQDCNPETCADESRPVITILEPDDGESVGCSRDVRARIQSELPIANAEVVFLDGANVVDRMTMQANGDVYASPPLADTSVFLDLGAQSYEVRATDMRGRTSTAARTMDLAFEVPVATMTPNMVGYRDAPFDVTVQASAAAGITSIVLYRAPVMDDEVNLSDATEVARTTSSPLTTTIDPTMLPDGAYALVPVVTDAVGNVLEADGDFIPDTRMDGTLGSDAVYWCLFDSGEDNVPVRLLIVGAPSLAPAKMRDHLQEAIDLAAARDPVADLVEVRGFGLRSDGTVPLDERTGDGGKWWRYVFFNFTDDRRIEVTWFSLADGEDSPVVEVTENDQFGFAYAPFGDISALEDSDVIAAAYEAANGCGMFTGSEDDDMRYENDDPFSTNDVVYVTAQDLTWKATAATPITEIFMCE